MRIKITEEEALILNKFQESEKVRVIVRLKSEMGEYSENKEFYDNLAQEVINSVPEDHIESTGIMIRGFAAKITVHGFYLLRINPHIEKIVLSKEVSAT